MPHISDLNCHSGATRGFSESACVPIHTCCTLYPLKTHTHTHTHTHTQTLLASLLSVFVEALFCKTKGPKPLSLTTGLEARIQCSQCCDPAPSLGPTQVPLQAIAGQGHLRSIYSTNCNKTRSVAVLRSKALKIIKYVFRKVFQESNLMFTNIMCKDDHEDKNIPSDLNAQQ